LVTSRGGGEEGSTWKKKPPLLPPTNRETSTTRIGGAVEREQQTIKGQGGAQRGKLVSARATRGHFTGAGLSHISLQYQTRKKKDNVCNTKQKNCVSTSANKKAPTRSPKLQSEVWGRGAGKQQISVSPTNLRGEIRFHWHRKTRAKHQKKGALGAIQ